MIEKLSNGTEIRDARRRGVAPSLELRAQFLALADQVIEWGQSRPGPKAIGVAALLPGAGSSTVAFNLAASLASTQRAGTLLVEANFGHARLSRRLGLGRAEGLAELLAHPESDREYPLAPTMTTDLFVMGPGQVSSDAVGQLPYGRLRTLIDERFQAFEFAVFDLPPLPSNRTCADLATQLDAVLLVADGRFSDRRSVSLFRRRLEEAGVDLLGMVRNQWG